MKNSLRLLAAATLAVLTAGPGSQAFAATNFFAIVLMLRPQCLQRRCLVQCIPASDLARVVSLPDQ